MYASFASLRAPERLAALHAYALTPAPEEPYDRFTRIAAQALGFPFARLTIVESDVLWSKSMHGHSVKLRPLQADGSDPYFCLHVTRDQAPLVLEDAQAHPAFAGHPDVAAGRIGAYVGVPLKTPQGHVLGTLCVLDTVPHPCTPAQVALLEDLACLVTDEMELARHRRALDAEVTRSRQLMDGMRSAYFVLDSEGVFTYLNREATRLFGERGQAGTSVWEALPMLRQTRFHAEVLRAQQTQTVIHFREFCPGLPTWFDIRLVPLGAELGVFWDDVTEEEQHREALRQREQSFRTLAENQPDIVVRYDRDLCLRYANPPLAGASGFPVAELIGKRTVALGVLPERAALWEAQIERAFASDQPIQHAFSLPTRHGLRHYEARLVAERDADGQAISVLAATRDVTEKKQADARLHLLDTAIAHASDGVLIAEVDAAAQALAAVYVNDAMVHLSGYPREALLGQPPCLLVGPDADPDVTRRIQEAMGQGQAAREELVLAGQDRQPFWAEIFVTPVRSPDGVPTHFLYLLRDITERKLAERALERSAARYRALSGLIAAFALECVIDPAGQVQVDWVTDSVTDVLGYTPDELRVSDPFALIHEDDRALLNPSGRRLAEWEATTEFRIRRKDGTYVWVKSLSIWAQTEHAGTVRVLVAAQDVTAQKDTERTLVAAKEQAEELARLKSSFVANMSHEIRTPLTSILGFAEVLRDEVQADHLPFVELIAAGGRRLQETLTSVLELSQLQSHQMQPTVSQVRVDDLVAETAGLLQDLALTKGVTLVTMHDPSPLYAYLDRAMFNRVLTNLIGNAVKFTEQGCVTVTTRRGVGTFTIEVADTGVGIAPAFLPHLFDEFRQESTGLNRSHEGAGLGLAITHRLVALMGGQISVTSEKGQGSTFRVALPLGEAAAEAETNLPAEDRAPQLRVLIVEDDAPTRLLLEYLLRPASDVRTATNSAEALAAAAVARRFDAVLLDINLSGGASGLDLLGQLRRVEGCAEARFIAVTAHALPEDRARYLGAGFDAYIAKPFTRALLFEAIHQATPGGREGAPG